MKPLNKYRSTEKFCISGTVVESIVAVRNWCQQNQKQLVGLTPTEGGDGVFRFTVRVIEPNRKLRDYILVIRFGDCGVVTYTDVSE